MTELRRYTFKLSPNMAQEAALWEQAQMCAMLWNALLDMRETHYRRAKQRGEKKTSLSAFDQGKDITALNAAAKSDPDLAAWRMMPRGTQERVADMLDLAMKAFFKRAKGGAGASSGYPRFKRVRDADSIPLREPVKSCWKFAAHSGPAGNSEPRARGEEGKSRRPRGEEGFHDSSCANHYLSSRARGGGGACLDERKWRLAMRGIPGAIKARGKFPVQPLSHKTGDVKYYDGSWWFSVCVEMEPRRVAGSKKLTVELDLIDEFASVKFANGQCVAGLSDPFSAERKGEFSNICRAEQESPCNDPANAGGAQELPPARALRHTCGDPANAGEAQAILAAPDAVQSARDKRYKRGSIRWLREKRRVARIKAKQARRTREALHKWTTAVVAQASELTVIAPPVKDMTKSGRGNEKFHGAEVKTIAAVNRHVLAMAPASAVQMLEYKAREAGVAQTTERRADHQLSVGGDLRAAAIATRRARRVTKRKQQFLEAAE